MKLSVVMPAQNEEGSVGATVEGVAAVLEREEIDYEVVVVDDGSEDSTGDVVRAIAAANPRVRCHRSHYEKGFGMAIRAGLDVFEGDAVAIVMADASDDPEDLVRYYRVLEEGWDCAFGSRFEAGARVHDYPRLKLTINRLANWFIRVLFRHHYNDTTNAFKAYRREVIETIQPLLSKHFNLTVEMPLKAIVRGHTYKVIPTNWTNRTSGEAKLAMKEMGSRYLFIVLYVWLEATLSRGDYRVSKEERRADGGGDGEFSGDSVDRAIEALAGTPVREVQKRGYHFQARDFYSALNDLPFLEENWDLWHDRPAPRAIEWDVDAQLEQVRRIAPYFAELADVPFDPPPGPPSYHWANDFWRAGDALVQYGLLRQLKPRRVVEVGAGWSSLLMAKALRRNQEEGEQPAAVDQVEPYPRTELLSVLPERWRLHRTVLQRADLGLFELLEDGDVCFYDGSHVARAGSDVVWLFFEVLPRLKPGVLVHVHDVFWPGDYPDSWIVERGQTWNEQYVLQAFLMYNSKFKPLICNSMLHHERRDEIEDLYRRASETETTGSSVWLRRVGE